MTKINNATLKTIEVETLAVCNNQKGTINANTQNSVLSVDIYCEGNKEPVFSRKITNIAAGFGDVKDITFKNKKLIVQGTSETSKTVRLDETKEEAVAKK